jgi:hypothetical protein
VARTIELITPPVNAYLIFVKRYIEFDPEKLAIISPGYGDVNIEWILLNPGTCLKTRQALDILNINKTPNQTFYIRPYEPNNIYVRIERNGKGKIHRVVRGESAEQVSLAPAQAYGVALQEPDVKVKGSPYFASISETTKNKLASVFTFDFNIGRFAPLPGRENDIYDAYILLKQCAELDKRLRYHWEWFYKYFNRDIEAAKLKYQGWKT